MKTTVVNEHIFLKRFTAWVATTTLIIGGLLAFGPATSASAVPVACASSHANNALHFSGKPSGSAVVVPNSPTLDGISDFTVSADIRWNGVLGYQGIVSKPAAAMNGSGIALIISDGKIGLALGFLLKTAPVIHSRVLIADSAISNTQWHHVAASYDGQVTNLYVDGVLVKSQDYEYVDFPYTAETNVIIGREFTDEGYFADRAFRGDIDNVQFSAGALPAATVPGAYFAFDNITDGIATDYCPSENNGTLSAKNTPTLVVGSGALSVTYALNSASGSAPVQASVQPFSRFTTASSAGITRAGYSFAGWSDGVTTYPAAAEFKMPTVAVSLTAVWAPNARLTVDVFNERSSKLSKKMKSKIVRFVKAHPNFTTVTCAASTKFKARSAVACGVAVSAAASLTSKVVGKRNNKNGASHSAVTLTLSGANVAPVVIPADQPVVESFHISYHFSNTTISQPFAGQEAKQPVDLTAYSYGALVTVKAPLDTPCWTSAIDCSSAYYWNTMPDGSGQNYFYEDTFSISDDIDLYLFRD